MLNAEALKFEILLGRYQIAIVAFQEDYSKLDTRVPRKFFRNSTTS